MKKNLKIIIAILAVVTLIVVIVALSLAGKKITAKNVLIREINGISEQTLNMEIQSTGEYAKVEKQVKEDCKLYFDSIAKLKENYETIATFKMTNIDNYTNDGPSFTNSLEKIASVQKENNELLDALSKFVSEDEMMGRAELAEMNSECRELYKEILGQIKLSDGVTAATEKNAKFDEYLTALNDLLTYMRDNQDEWFLEKGELKSKSDVFISEYNKKVAEVDKFRANN